MAKNPLIAFLQSKLDDARRELRAAAVDFDIPDEKVLELRENARRVFFELKAQDQAAAKKGLLSAFKFW
jgi:hypothetical protein